MNQNPVFEKILNAKSYNGFGILSVGKTGQYMKGNLDRSANANAREGFNKRGQMLR
jgi:hypothetical protein